MGKDGLTRKERAKAYEAAKAKAAAPAVDPTPHRKLSTELILAIVALILAIIALRDMYPFWSNVSILLAALIFWGSALWKWEQLKDWSPRKRAVVVLAVVAASVVFSFYPMEQQYRASEINLLFKDSPRLTWWRRQIITYDITNFKDYLASLNFLIPDTTPPVAAVQPTRSSLVQWEQPPEYRQQIEILEPEIQNRKIATENYGQYVLRENFNKNENYPNDIDTDLLTVFAEANWALNWYLNSSFWDSREMPTGSAPSVVFADVFWEIRSRLGKPYTDRLAAYTFKTLVDSPQENSGGNDPNVIFWRKVKTADTVLESGTEKWNQIIVILKARGQPTDGL